MPMPRADHLPVLAVVMLSVVLVSCRQQPAVSAFARRPIIVVDIGALRADHLGCYGYSRETSQNIDSFAEESVQFQWAFSQAPNTPPSQASILTGLYPTTHGLIEDDDRVPDSVVTLAEAVNGRGYITAAFHDGGFLNERFNIGQGFTELDSSGASGVKAIGPKVIAWLRVHANDPSFLLLIHTTDIHTPYAPVPPFSEMFMDGVPEPSPGFAPTTAQMEKVRLSKYTGDPSQLSDNDLAFAVAQYDGEIRYVDTWFGEFMNIVRQTGLDKRSIIVLISDHGEEFQEHGSVLHEKLYSTVTHIPLMIRLPSGEDARRVTTVVESVDLMPTLLELTGVPIPTAVQGGSLVPEITGTVPLDGGIAFGESPWFGRRRFAAAGEFQLLVARKFGKLELYNLVLDPAEQHEISQLHPDVTARLLRAIDDWEDRVTAARVVPDDGSSKLDDEIARQLRDLGYIQ